MNQSDMNKIICADCMDKLKETDSKSIDLIITDIPYGEVTKNGAERAQYKGQLRNLNKGAGDVVTFNLSEFLAESARVAKGSIYIFCGIEQVSDIYRYFDAHKEFIVRQCGWRKTNPSPMNGQHMWESTMENCIFAKRRKTKFKAPCRSAIWDYPVVKGKIHPTQKPVELIQELIEASSDEGDLVLDTCMGSGTTAIAAIRTKRNFIGYEINADYCNDANIRVAKEIINTVGTAGATYE